MKKEVTNVPELRFPEFVDDWEISTINKLAKVTSGGTPNRGTPSYWNGSIPWVTTSLINREIITEAGEYITQEGLDNSSAKLFPAGTILIALYGQGITRGKVAIQAIEAATNQACAAILLNSNKANTKFIFFELQRQYERIRDLSNDGGQKNLSGELVKSIKVVLPALPEQQKIASFLSAVDKKIEQLARKKELLEQYKKGVTQKIFSQEIRFKDDNGQGYPDWEEKRLEDIAEKIDGGGTPSTKESTYWNGEIPWVSSSDLTEKTIHRINYSRFITKTAVNESATKLIPERSLIVVTRVGVGKVAINNCAITTSQDFSNIIAPSCDVVFLAYYIKQAVNRLLCFNQGTSIKGVVKSDLKALEVPVPSGEEQHKIADFLSSIDDKITAVQTQLTQNQNFKKGLLQKMFV